MKLPSKEELFSEWREAQDDYYPKEMRFRGFYGHEVPSDKILILCSCPFDLAEALNEYVDHRFEEEEQKHKLYFDINDAIRLQKRVFHE